MVYLASECQCTFCEVKFIRLCVLIPLIQFLYFAYTFYRIEKSYIYPRSNWKPQPMHTAFTVKRNSHGDKSTSNNAGQTQTARNVYSGTLFLCIIYLGNLGCRQLQIDTLIQPWKTTKSTKRTRKFVRVQTYFWPNIRRRCRKKQWKPSAFIHAACSDSLSCWWPANLRDSADYWSQLQAFHRANFSQKHLVGERQYHFVTYGTKAWLRIEMCSACCNDKSQRRPNQQIEKWNRGIEV